MSRHRNVRTMDYGDDYEGYDDACYGHSFEDSNMCVSPSTEKEFMFDRTNQSMLSNYVESEEIPEETYNDEDSIDRRDSLTDSANYTRPKLNPLDEARLNSCLEEMNNILGESTPEHIMIDAVIKSNFEYEAALSCILNAQESPSQSQEAPKPQRERRQRRSVHKVEEDNSGSSLNSDSSLNSKRLGSLKLDEFSSSPAPPPVDIAARLACTGSVPSQTGANPSSDIEVKIQAPPKEEVVGHKGPVISNRGNGDTPIRKNDNNEAASLATPKKKREKSPGPVAAVSTPYKAKPKSKEDLVAAIKEYEKRKENSKESINLVVIGHVDAGKSTLMGHVLYQLGFVNKRTMHKYEQESKKLGKASFAFAWVLDETDEERARGVTMDVAQTRFETETKVVNLMDAPGHKDFIPNMITGAAQADVAILVVNANRGEFETGFEAGGQTREHAILIRSLGVSQLVVAINKLDTVEWSQDRFNEISKKLGSFLKKTGFKDNDVSVIPCSGLTGQNLTQHPDEANLLAWYNGPTLLQGIDSFQPPTRAIEKPFRMCITDVFKGMGSGISLAGTLQAGCVQPGDKILIMPQAEAATVKTVLIDECPAQYSFAGDNAVIVVTGIDISNVSIGSIVCEPYHPIPSSCRIQARVVVFNIDVPLTKGFPVVFHYQSQCEPATIRKLVSQLHKSTGEVVRSKPRCLTKNSNAVIELELSRPVCLELYKDYRELGRFMLRYSGHTIAAGLVTEIKDSKNTRTE